MVAFTEHRFHLTACTQARCAERAQGKEPRAGCALDRVSEIAGASVEPGLVGSVGLGERVNQHKPRVNRIGEHVALGEPSWVRRPQERERQVRPDENSESEDGVGARCQQKLTRGGIGDRLAQTERNAEARSGDDPAEQELQPCLEVLPLVPLRVDRGSHLGEDEAEVLRVHVDGRGALGRR